MSLFDTSEEFYARRDQFVQYIFEKVNPAREQSGLRPIDLNDARECFRILDKFFAEWRSLGKGASRGE